jgi:uncharacterized membrane protein affecting hemolysin expression
MSSDAFYVGIVVALVFVLISILYWFSTVNGSKAYSNSQLSELYKSLLGDGMVRQKCLL